MKANIQPYKGMKKRYRKRKIEVEIEEIEKGTRLLKLKS